MPSSPTPSAILTVTPPLSSARAQLLVFHVLLFILAFCALIVLLRLPRVLARFWRPSEWLSGHFLWHSSYRRSYPRSQKMRHVQQDEIYSHKDAKEGPSSTDDSHTLYSSHPTRRQGVVDINLPPHVPTCPTFLRRLVTLHRIRLSPSFSIAQALAMLFYFFAMLYAAVYRSSPFSDPLRAGWITVAQIPLVIALGTKNNIFGALIGFTYEKLNFLHRFIGRLAVISVNIHALGYFFKWSLGGIFRQQLARPSNMWGLVGLVALDCMFFFTLSFWRKNYRNIMYPTHIIGVCLIIPSVWKHKPVTMAWMASAIGIYGLDRILRVLKTRVTTAIIRPIPELMTTHVEIPVLNAGWRAGQHVRLRVLSFGVGWFGWTEVHPFTIANVVANGEEGMTLMIKKSGKWTNRLYEMAKNSGYTEGGDGRRVKVMVEGPYGGPCHAIFSSYSAAIFIIGGSGITFALSAIQDLIRQDLKGSSRVKDITLIWSVQDYNGLRVLLPRFANMIQESAYTPLHIQVHYTRASLGGGGGGDEKAPAILPPGLTISSGRPKIAKALEASLARAVSLTGGAKDEGRVCGMLVGVCGPVGLGDDVSRAVTGIDPARRDQVGGIEMHEEVFAL